MPTRRMIAELEGGNIEAEHCVIRHVAGEVELVPLEGARCCINNVSVEGPTKLSQGTESRILLLVNTTEQSFTSESSV